MKILRRIILVGLICIGLIGVTMVFGVVKASDRDWDAYKGESMEMLDKGNVVEYYPDYYCAHNYTPYGIQILMLKPGDTVRINGRKIVIDGQFNVDITKGYYGNARMKVGNGNPMLQTCLYGNEVVIKYGHYSNSKNG